MKIINRTEVKDRIANLKNGTIYSVSFVKKDGSIRLMNSIVGTRKGVTGEGLKFDAKERGLMPVYDVQLRLQGTEEHKCWRMVNLNTIFEVHINKETFSVID